MRKFLRNLKRWFRGGRKVNVPRRSRSAQAPRGKNSLRRLFFPVIIIFLIAGFSYGFYRFDRQILPLVLQEAELRIQTEINNIINYVVHEIIVANDVAATDFIIQSQLGPEAKPTISVNTVLANEICNAAAQA
ncbi:MAG: hypothetical protein FWF80_00510, partial [Defluviitaleaceae bacterium]|nr:hypothetical protein [Defluviitaleaceae bacterium]